MNISVKWMPVLLRLGVAAGTAAVFFYSSADLKSAQLVNVAGVLASFVGTLLGFMVTSVALLTAVMDRRLVANMRKTGHYERLVSETFATCIAFFTTAVLCLYALFLEGIALSGVFVVVVFEAALSFLYAIETGRRFTIVISTLR